MDQKALQIIVNSFDFDHCLFNKNYDPEQPNSVVKANLDFLNGIIKFCLEQAQSGSIRVYNCIFSNRQFFGVDKHNSENYKTESCFIAMQKVHDYLALHLKHPNIEIILDKCLLSDSYQGINPGDTFDGKNQHEPIYFFDFSKLNILYFQVNRIASLSENAGVPILYRCFDDNYLMLYALLGFTQKKVPHWFGSNIRMQFYKYLEGELELKGETIGTGKTDYEYGESIKKLFYAAIGFVKNDVRVKLIECFREFPWKIERFEKSKSISLDSLKSVEPEAKQDDTILQNFFAKRMQRFTEHAYQGLGSLIPGFPRLMQARNQFFGDTIYHLIAMSGDVEAMKYFLNIGINPSLMVNNFGESVMDLACESMKVWLKISESESFPDEIYNGSQRKKYIELKLNFLIASHSGNLLILKQIRDVLCIKGIENLNDFKVFVTDDLASLKVLNLVKLWHESNYDEDTISEEDTKSFSEDETSTPLPSGGNSVPFQLYEDQELGKSEKNNSYSSLWLVPGSDNQGETNSTEEDMQISPRPPG